MLKKSNYRFIYIIYDTLDRLSVESQILETEDFSKYQGLWVAILDKKIIATGKTMAEVYENAFAKGIIRTPLFQKIPKKGEIDTFIL